MHALRYVTVLCGIALIGCNEAPTAASTSDLDANFKAIQSRDVMTFNTTACNGEPVAGETQQHAVLVFNSNGNNSVSITMVHDHITGIGALTGAKYTGMQFDKTKAINHGEGGVYQTMEHFILRGNKHVPDTHMKAMTDIVIGPDGDPKVSKVSYSSSCDYQP